MQTASSLIQRVHAFWKCYQARHLENNWQKMQMCWLLQSKAREKIVMCLEWQAEVSHTDTAGPNDISAWKCYTTRGGRWNVNMQTNVWMTFGISCHVSVWVMWFNIYSCSPGANLVMLISDGRNLVCIFARFPKSTPASSDKETCHKSPQSTCSRRVVGMQF